MPSETPEGRDAEQAARRQFERLQFELYRADRANQDGREFIQQDRARRDQARAALDALPPEPAKPPPVITISETIFEPLQKGGNTEVAAPPPSAGIPTPPLDTLEAQVCVHDESGVHTVTRTLYTVPVS